MNAEEQFQELAAGALRGDASRARTLFDGVWDVIARLAQVATRMHRATGRLDSNDCRTWVVHEVAAEVWRSRKSYSGHTPGELSNWIKRIAWRVGWRRRRPGAGTNAALPADLPEPPRPEALDDALKIRLRECLEGLREHDPEAYDVIVLTYFAGLELSQRDIAAELWGRRSLKTRVADLTRRGLRALLSCLARHGVTEL